MKDKTKRFVSLYKIKMGLKYKLYTGLCIDAVGGLLGLYLTINPTSTIDEKLGIGLMAASVLHSFKQYFDHEASKCNILFSPDLEGKIDLIAKSLYENTEIIENLNEKVDLINKKITSIDDIVDDKVTSKVEEKYWNKKISDLGYTTGLTTMLVGSISYLFSVYFQYVREDTISEIGDVTSKIYIFPYIGTISEYLIFTGGSIIGATYLYSKIKKWLNRSK